MKNIFIMTFIIFMLGASLTSQAGSEKTQRFIGLWEGVDPEDGALNVLSITNNNDGKVTLLLYGTYWTTCDGRRGIAQGTAEVSDNQVLIPDNYVVTCFETDITVKLESEFTLNSDETLTEKRSRSGVSSPSVTYHRTSK